MPLFGKPKYTFVRLAKRRAMPDGLWVRCPDCGDIIYKKRLEENFKVCPRCNYHFTLTAQERIELLLDKRSFQERDATLTSLDPLNFTGVRPYKDKLKEVQEATRMRSAAISGEGTILKQRVVFVVTDSRFLMGSMGSVVGEKITRGAEFARKNRLPLVIASGSGGGARMYEGMLSLMQMAKTAAAVRRLKDSGLLFISILTNPTMAGVLASFASLGDVIIAEPKALIGFTGPRVIEQTIRQKLPSGFQTAEFLLEHGLIDMVVNRKEMKAKVAQILGYFVDRKQD